MRTPGPQPLPTFHPASRVSVSIHKAGHVVLWLKHLCGISVSSANNLRLSPWSANPHRPSASCPSSSLYPPPAMGACFTPLTTSGRLPPCFCSFCLKHTYPKTPELFPLFLLLAPDRCPVSSASSPFPALLTRLEASGGQGLCLFL